MSTHSVKHSHFLDRWGVALSGLCALHCISVPILTLFIPMLSTYADGLLFHIVMLVSIVPIAMFALYRGFQKHSSRKVILAGLAGLTFLVLDIVLEALDAQILHIGKFHFLPVIGSCFLVYAHLKNRSLCLCAHDHGPTCAHDASKNPNNTQHTIAQSETAT